MKHFQVKRTWRNYVQTKPVLIFLFLVMLGFSWSVLGFWGKMADTRQNRELAEDKVALLREQKEALTASIGKLETEAGQEESIREKFGYAKEGEGLIVIVDDKNAKKEEPVEEEGGFFGFFKNLFK